MENLLNFALDMSKTRKLSDKQIAILNIKDWLNDLEKTNPEVTQLIRDVLDTIEE